MDEMVYSADDMHSLRSMCDKWRQNLFGSVMPFWMRHSIDEECGGFLTCLDNDGSCYDETKYTWLQGRQVYMLSRLFNEVTPDTALGAAYEGDLAADRAAWFAAASGGAAFMEHAVDAKRDLIFFSTSRDGARRLHLQRKPYAAVFYVLGYLEFWHALRTAREEGVELRGDSAGGTGACKYLAGALRMFDKLARWLRDPSLCGGMAVDDGDGGDEGEGEGAKASVLADVMCLACLALEFLWKIERYGRCADVAAGGAMAYDGGRERYLSLIRDAMHNCERHFDSRPATGASAADGGVEPRPSRNVFLEHCAPGGISDATPAARLLNPGHSIEVAWFLLRMCDAIPGGSARHEALALRALEGSLHAGWDEENGGGLLYMMDVAGRPLLNATVMAEGKLWWPCTESLITLTMAYARTGDAKWMAWLRKVHEYTFRTFVERADVRNEAGEWFGYCNRDGSLARTCKGGNYKGCFHVPRCLLMCAQIADECIKAHEPAGSVACPEPSSTR